MFHQYTLQVSIYTNQQTFQRGGDERGDESKVLSISSFLSENFNFITNCSDTFSSYTFHNRSNQPHVRSNRNLNISHYPKIKGVYIGGGGLQKYQRNYTYGILPPFPSMKNLLQEHEVKHMKQP